MGLHDENAAVTQVHFLPHQVGLQTTVYFLNIFVHVFYMYRYIHIHQLTDAAFPKSTLHSLKTNKQVVCVGNIF